MSDEVVELLIEWRDKFKSYLLSKSLLGVAASTNLLEGLDDIIKALDVPSSNGLMMNKVHPIDRLGCGLAVLSMYCDGMDTVSIAKTLHTQTGTNITSSEVQAWINSYEESGVVRRSTMSNLSIFDTKNRMEDIYLMLQKVMVQIDEADEAEFTRAKTTKHDVRLAAVGQIRSAVKDARQVVEALHQMNTYRELADIILQEMGMESPALQSRVLKRLKEKGAVIKAILPSA